MAIRKIVLMGNKTVNSDHRRKIVGATVGGLLIVTALWLLATGPEHPLAEY